jgi:hypothetical protein
VTGPQIVCHVTTDPEIKKCRWGFDKPISVVFATDRGPVVRAATDSAGNATIRIPKACLQGASKGAKGTLLIQLWDHDPASVTLPLLPLTRATEVTFIKVGLKAHPTDRFKQTLEHSPDPK